MSTGYKRPLSHSALNSFENYTNSFVVKYILNLPAEKQATPAMTLGSATDIILKNDIQRDLGLEVVPYPITSADMAMAEEAVRITKACGEYDLLLKRLRKALDGGGSVLFEHKLLRDVEDFQIVGYIDLCFRDSPNGQWYIIDFKTNGFYSTSPVSPKAPYNRYSHINGNVKAHPLFVNIRHDTWCGIGETITPDHIDQVYLYSKLLNEPHIEEHIGGIFSIMPNGCAVSMGVLKSNVLERFVKMNEAIKSGHIFTDMTFEENLERIEDLKNPYYRAVFA